MLRAYFLGELRFCNDDREISDLAGRKAGVLLAYLMLNAGRRFSREHLADAIWEEALPNDPPKAIRQELWAARAALNKSGLDADGLLITDGGDVGFRDGVLYWLDVSEFETAVKGFFGLPSPTKKDFGPLGEATALYRGDLLPGLYSDWCLYPREALRDRFLNALEYLMYVHEADRDWDAAIRFAKRLLEADSLLEYVHRGLMRCYYAKGNRALALKQFETCRKILAREFSEPVEPMADTVKLFEQIKREAFDAAMPPLPEPPAIIADRAKEPPPRDEAANLSELSAAQDSLKAAHRRIDDVIRNIRRR